MSRLTETLTRLCEEGARPDQTVAASMERSGRKAIGCFPLYTPDEVVDAAGFLPVGLWGGTTQPQRCAQYLQSFCCSVMRANLEQGLAGTYRALSAVLIPTYCDTLKCICENWKVAIPELPALPMVYPQNRKGQAGENYLICEYQRIALKLQALGGKPVTEKALAESLGKYEACRAAQREFVLLAASHPEAVSAKQRHLVLKAGYFLDKADYTAQLTLLNQELKMLPESTFTGKRLVVTGLMLEPVELLDLLDQTGCCIVADDLAQESRQFRTPAPAGETPWQQMARRYAAQNADPLLYEPKKSRGAKLIDLVQKNHADGIVVAMMKFCDPEEFDYPIYKKELEAAGIPMLYLETEQSMTKMEMLRTRIEAFVELLSD